jgi:nicotinate-nucleotide pyrophosphorylase (carboxylating)
MSEWQVDSRMTRVIEFALLEDSGLGDPTSEAIFSEGHRSSGIILLKEDGIVAGVQAAQLVFQICDPDVRLEPLLADGRSGIGGSVVANLEGETRSILRAERVALNLLQRMSGIATLTRRFADAVSGTRARITDTRKTAPGLRMFDKWAVLLGGGVNHRFGLDDMILIKDNHIAAAGGLTRALQLCREYLSARQLSIPIEVETGSLEEVGEALRCGGFQRIMLDNFSLEHLRKAVQMIDGAYEVEASGGITLDNVRSRAETGVDLISIGALTHSPKSIDLSLDLAPVHVR